MAISYQVIDGWTREGKICTKCKKWYPIEDFPHIRKKADIGYDVNARSSKCYKCTLEAENKRNAKKTKT